MMVELAIATHIPATYWEHADDAEIATALEICDQAARDVEE
jgi:hypothetical protein